MAQHSHVPKFGNWDGENIPYTMYFENARKEKGGGKMINPNDPEQNPEAFNGGSFNPRVENTDHKRALRREEVGGSRDYIEAAQRYDSINHRKSLDPQNTRRVRSNNSDTGSDRSNSNSDRSLMQSHHRRRRSGQGSSADGSHGFAPSPARPTRSKTGSSHAEEQSHKVAAIPKFGSWDETDPRSGEGFTIIFDKVKEQKQMGSTNTGTIPTEPVVYSNTRQNHGNSSPKRKMCCCFFP